MRARAAQGAAAKTSMLSKLAGRRASVSAEQSAAERREAAAVRRVAVLEETLRAGGGRPSTARPSGREVVVHAHHAGRAVELPGRQLDVLARRCARRHAS